MTFTAPRHVLGILGIGALAVLAPADSYACTCSRNPAACEALWETAAVFVGDVVQMDDTTRPGPTPSLQVSQRGVRLRVIEAFRGKLGETVDVMTGRGGGDCGFAFVSGERYLVYAIATPAGYQTGICQRTRHVKNATEDLAYLRSVSQTLPKAGAIVGTVTHVEPDDQGDPTLRTPFAGARIVAEADGGVFEGFTGNDGRYQIAVPTGTYRVRVDVAESYYVQPRFLPRDAVLVRDARGCASVDVWVQANGRIAGRVVDARGEPAARLTIEAQSVRPAARVWPYTPRSTLAVTNDSGEYELSALFPGSYTLGVYGGTRFSDRNPDERIPLAATRASTGPERVQLSAGVRVVLDDLRLPPEVAIAQVTGTVRLPDGRPAAGGKVYVYAESVAYRRLAEPGTIDADGRFAIGVVAGRRYRFVAELLLNNPRRLFQGESSGFEATPALAPFEIDLTQR